MPAIISDCGRYRYWLSRSTEAPEKEGAVLFVMLNPSTADHTVDDPTIRKCRGFSRLWGKAHFEVVNLYAYRATDPDELFRVDDPVGPENGHYLRQILGRHKYAVCAWGTKALHEHVEAFFNLARETGTTLFCLDWNKSGSPKHPLYVKYSKELEPWYLHRLSNSKTKGADP